MTFRGNHRLLYASQFVTGILTWFLSVEYGIAGLVIGILPFLAGQFAVLYKHHPDEREMSLSHQINSYESIGTGVFAGLIYFLLPQVNWFFALISGISVIRGIVGMIVFSVR
ncbi:MAG TPA: hypothetical protein P5533_00160 [Candidatus Cloacimonadota bacterium]|nr:hypothetical protein [Candidatus Cloacimonadota bacterium]